MLVGQSTHLSPVAVAYLLPSTMRNKLCCTLLFLAAAIDAQRIHFETDIKPARPRSWQPVLSFALTAQDPMIELSFAVKQQNTSSLFELHAAVSDPDSPQYGRHLSSAAVDSLVAPASESSDAVKLFVTNHNMQWRCATPNCGEHSPLNPSAY